MQEDFIPLKSIGLCFSGGGYRATFFSLGVVSYLSKIQFKNKALIHNVEAISTVSGGTLFGVAYAKAAQEPDFNFETFFKKFYNLFEPSKDQLLATAIAKLNDDTIWKNSHKKRTLINAFALTYADMDIYKGNFELFEEPTSPSLKNVCFNATDFAFGLVFRFQNTGKFGNNPLGRAEVTQIKNEVPLADIVASSSCFPLGFEPLTFPDDYIINQTTEEYKAVKDLELFKDGVGIMDGGIADNQGIGSMMRISERRRDERKEINTTGKRKRELDLIIVSDVASYKMTPWQPEPKAIYEGENIKNKASNLLSYLGLKPLYWILIILGILMMIVSYFELISGESWTALYILGGISTGIGIILTIFGIVTGRVKGFVTDWIRTMFRKNVPEPLVDEVLSFKNLRLDLVQRMLTERVSSTVVMVNDIFLKQIRRLNYKYLYFKKGREYRSVTSTVYQLNGAKTAYGRTPFNKKITKPTPELENIALLASQTPTTLWWDEDDIEKGRMDTLIACGQFTTCYTLMDYILKLKASDITLTSAQISDIDALLKALEADWATFNKNPMFYVNSLKS